MTSKLTASQLKTLHFYQTGTWVNSLQSNHKIAAERILRGKDLLQVVSGTFGKLELTEAGKLIDTTSVTRIES